jgi:hypothetical protein
MDVTPRRVPLLERELLRRSLSALTAGREPCAGCRRTPLVGERVYAYGDGRLACELCRARRGEDPVGSEPVRGVEHGQSVRLRPAA